MASDRILALNIGASHLTLGEFRVASGKNPELVQYGVAPLGLDPDSDMDPSGFIVAALQDIMKSKGIRPGPLVMSVSGQAVFPRFVKVPSTSKDKIKVMIQSEAEQNVPFPIDELTWDYQLVGGDEMGEQNAMIVAAKTDNIVALTNAVAVAGLEPEIVDVAPLAIYNCVCFSQPAAEGCTMVLDIGSRSTNLVFIEAGKVFYRSIPVAGNTITQEIAKSFQIDFRAAEKMKCEGGFVALGGVTAAEDETADRMSKCIRSVATRLHAEVNRSINFYRSQQGGSAPSRAFLTGGSSILQYLDNFFREKLRIDVDFLNPFDRVKFGSRVDTEKASEDFYQLAEVVGMAARRSDMGVVSINLMPPNLVEKKTFRRRIPIFAFAGISLVAASALFMLAGGVKKGVADFKRDEIKKTLSVFDGVSKKITAEEGRRDAVVAELDRYRRLIDERTIVLRRLDAVRASLLPGMWLVSMETNPDCKSVTIICRGFSDALKQAEAKVGDKTAAEIFGDHLVAKKPFVGLEDGKAKVEQQRNVYGSDASTSDKVKEFKLVVGLSPECQFGPVGGKVEE